MPGICLGIIFRKQFVGQSLADCGNRWGIVGLRMAGLENSWEMVRERILWSWSVSYEDCEQRPVGPQLGFCWQMVRWTNGIARLTFLTVGRRGTTISQQLPMLAQSVCAIWETQNNLISNHASENLCFFSADMLKC